LDIAINRIQWCMAKQYDIYELWTNTMYLKISIGSQALSKWCTQILLNQMMYTDTLKSDDIHRHS